MNTPLFTKLSGFFRLSAELRADLASLKREEVRLSAGDYLIRHGDRYQDMYLVEDGWMLRARGLPGGTRQIVNVPLAGDFVCYNAMMFERAEFDLVARTQVRLSRFACQSFESMMHNHPGLAAALAWSNAREETLLAERVVSLGRRDSVERLAHLLCELHARMAMVGPSSGAEMIIPLIQEDFADILGISVIHIVRTFKRLAMEDAVEYRTRRIFIRDLEKLQRIGGFESHYLHFTQRSDARWLRA